MENKHFLIICRRAPFGSSLARESLDIAMAAATFGQRVCLLFQDDGVYQLLTAQESSAIERKPLDAIIRALPLYEIDTVYADPRSLEERGLEPGQLTAPVELLRHQSLADFIRDFDVVMTF